MRPDGVWFSGVSDAIREMGRLEFRTTAGVINFGGILIVAVLTANPLGDFFTFLYNGYVATVLRDRSLIVPVPSLLYRVALVVVAMLICLAALYLCERYESRKVSNAGQDLARRGEPKIRKR